MAPPSLSAALTFVVPSRNLLVPAVKSHGGANPQPPPRTFVCSLRSPTRAVATPLSASSSKTPYTVQDQDEAGEVPYSVPPLPNWGDFANRISGEWDGHGAEFTNEGIPIELPENIVPEAFREWGVQVFDWQTQCPTVADISMPKLTYKLIKLLPTVGCEADAATRYSVEERTIGGIDNKVSSFGYNQGGNYVAVWNSHDASGGRIFELEHCLVDPRDHEARVRVIQVLWTDGTTVELQKIKVFSENWYGPFRNGEQLGGCSIKQSGFTSTDALKESEILGAWQGTMVAAIFQNAQKGEICELVDNQPQRLTRDKEGIVTLPKQLWSALKERGGSEIQCEVGWLLDHGHALTSSCAFLKDGSLRKIVMGQEAAIFEG